MSTSPFSNSTRLLRFCSTHALLHQRRCDLPFFCKGVVGGEVASPKVMWGQKASRERQSKRPLKREFFLNDVESKPLLWYTKNHSSPPHQRSSSHHLIKPSPLPSLSPSPYPLSFPLPLPERGWRWGWRRGRIEARLSTRVRDAFRRWKVVFLGETVWCSYLQNYPKRMHHSTPSSMCYRLFLCYSSFWPSYGRRPSAFDKFFRVQLPHPTGRRCPLRWSDWPILVFLLKNGCKDGSLVFNNFSFFQMEDLFFPFPPYYPFGEVSDSPKKQWLRSIPYAHLWQSSFYWTFCGFAGRHIGDSLRHWTLRIGASRAMRVRVFSLFGS